MNENGDFRKVVNRQISSGRRTTIDRYNGPRNEGRFIAQQECDQPRYFVSLTLPL